MLHDALHVTVLVLFLGALAMAFVGLATPLLFGERRDFQAPALWGSLALGAVALAGLGLEWAAHRLGWL